jgi:hypothetical protein
VIAGASGRRQAWRSRARLGQWQGQRGACGRRQRGELEWRSIGERRVGTVRSRRWRRSSYNNGEQRRRAAWADDSAARQDEERPARSDERRARCRSSTWCTEGWRGAVKARHMASEGGGASGRAKPEQSRAEGLKVDEGTNS